MNLDDALAAYRIYAKSEGQSPKTISWVTSSVRYFGDFLGSVADISTITGDDMRRFIIALREKPRYSNHPHTRTQGAKLSLQSISTYCRAIRGFFSFLCREGFLEVNPVEKVRLPKVPETVIPTHSEGDLICLLSQPDKENDAGFRDYAILLTLVDTTLRLSELAGLRVEDIDYEQNQLRVMGKGARERFVPFGRRVAKVLMKYHLKHRPEPIGTDRFWLRRDGLPLPAARIQKIVNSYGKKAGLKRSFPHQLRHTSSVMYLRNGGDLFSLQRKLGHKSLDMTRRYANLADSDVRDKHLQYGVADKLKL